MLLFLCLPRYSRRIVRSSYASLTCRLRRGSKTVGLQLFSEEGTEDDGICPRRPHRFCRWDVHCRGRSDQRVSAADVIAPWTSSDYRRLTLGLTIRAGLAERARSRRATGPSSDLASPGSFRRRDFRNSSMACLLDYQITRFGSPVLDMARAIHALA